MSKSKTYYNLPSDELEANLLVDRLWFAASKMRGHLDARDYRSYFLALFFYKYISDCYRKAILSDFDIHDPNTDKRLERFTIPSGSSFDEIAKIKDSGNLGEKLNKAFAGIEEVNQPKLEGILRHLDFNDSKILGEGRSKGNLLSTLINIFQTALPTQIYNNIIARSFELLLEKFTQQDGKKGEEFQTPFQISELLAKLLEPKKNESIYDPACGTGSLLIRTQEEIKERTDGANVYGEEINYKTWTTAKMNIIIHGLDRAKIVNGDSLNYPGFLDEGSTKKLKQFDIVVSNPPLSIDKWWKFGNEYDRFKWGMPPKSKGDYAFIQHILTSTSEKSGRAGVIVSHGVLFRGGIEAVIRQQIVNNNLLDAVIGLPSNLFYNTSIPVAILLFKKGRSQKDTVLFIDASKEFVQDKRKSILATDGIKKVIATYKAYTSRPNDKELAVQDGFSYISSIEEILANDYNLSLNRYIQYIEKEKEIDIDQLRSEVEQIDQDLERIRSEIKKRLSKLGL